MRRMKSDRSKKNGRKGGVITKTSSSRRLSSRPTSESNRYPKRNLDAETDESPEKRDASRPGYGYTEEKRDTRTGEGAIDKNPRPREEGRPDQLSGEEEDEIEAQEPMASAEQDVDNDEIIEEGDEEARGGIVKPDQEEDEELRRRRKGHGREEPQTHEPE